MYLRHSCESIRQRRCTASDVGLPFDHLAEYEPAVKPVGKGAEVAADMFFPNCMVGGMQRFFDIAQHRVDPGELWSLDTARAAASCDAPVRSKIVPAVSEV